MMPRTVRVLARFVAALLCLALLVMGRPAWGCACGCGVFMVGTGQMLPTDTGLVLFLEYDFLNQNKNWFGTSEAPGSSNDDKQIHTDFWTLGGEYLFNRNWGLMVRVPYWDRRFVTTSDAGNIVSLHSGSIGDIRVEGIYTGFSEDMSTGLTFGLKFPTGQWQAPGFDRDTNIGSGSTDLLLGTYHVGALGSLFTWFVQAKLDWPFATQGGYTPGGELDAALGVYFNGDVNSTLRISPVLQVLGSYRVHDSGPAGDQVNSGYTRVLLSAGLEVGIGNFSIYGDVEVPVYQNMNGVQLVASVLAKGIVAYHF